MHVKQVIPNISQHSIERHMRSLYEYIIYMRYKYFIIFRCIWFFVLFQAFFQSRLDILHTSLSSHLSRCFAPGRRNSWSIASPASPAPWSSTSLVLMLQIWPPRGTRKPWNSSFVVTAFLGRSLGGLKLNTHIYIYI